MSEFESEWTPDGEAPPKKRRFPKWLLVGCGCGCLTLVLVLVAGGLFVGKLVKEGQDPDVQWPKIQAALPFDQRPTDLELKLGMSLGILGFETYVLENRDVGYIATIQVHRNSSPNEMGMLFDPGAGDKVPFGLGEPVDGVAKTLTIQGEEHRALFYRTIGGQSDGEATGPGVRIDASGDQGFVLVDLRLLAGGPSEVPEDVIQSFFAHFNLGGG